MPHSIQLGLTFNGGVSLVVFQAGVAYELVRAVQFSRACHGSELAKSLDASLIDLPPGTRVPRLVVDVATGTSSGGMAAIQLVLALGGVDAEAVLARMLHTWIDGADFAYLIPPSNCVEQGLLTVGQSRRLMEALLDAANGTPPVTGDDRDRHKLEHDLDCYLTLTNFHGLREPVVLRESGTHPRAGRQQRSLPTTRRHEYELIDDDAIGHAVTDLDERERIISAVLATADFPVAFAPVVRPSSAIDEGETPALERTTFAYIDGGLVDNQPLTVALDALAERPALDRRLFLIDPRVDWVKPGYGDQAPDLTALDPLSIMLRLGDISRTDSVHQDLERVRNMEDQQDVINALRKQLRVLPALQQALLSAWPQVRERRFHAGAWALWSLLGGEGGDGGEGDDPQAPVPLVNADMRAVWAQVARQERLALRVRLAESISQLHLPAGHPARTLLANDDAWIPYYRALASVRKLDRRFRKLRYLVWTRHLDRPSGVVLEPEVFASHQSQIIAAFKDLNSLADKLEQTGQALLAHFADALHGDDADAKQRWREGFLNDARAMQVLEALAGTGYTPALRVRRLTPLDIYADDVDRNRLQPLAGGRSMPLAGS